MVRFIFDLDGTLTKSETLPIISDHFSLQERIAELTMQTVQGRIPFVKICCQAYSSEALIENNMVAKLTTILRKESVVDYYKKQGDFVVFIGDGNNDMEAMRLADVSIATGLIHAPAKSILAVADYAVYCEEALCRLLNQLL